MAEPTQVADLFEQAAAEQPPQPDAAPQASDTTSLFEQAAASAPAAVEQPGVMDTIKSVAADIGTGITELPRAVVKGGRDAVQEGAQTVADIATMGNYELPQLPDLAAPKSVTGNIAKSMTQFLVGMVGVGKITKPIAAIGKLAKAGKAGAAVVQSGKAAATGAIFFDPHGARLSDLVETSMPSLSNPVTRFLSADPKDSAALGRFKNAIESIGMDAAIGAAMFAGTRAAKAIRDFHDGKITKPELDAVVSEAEQVAQARTEPAGGKVGEGATPATPEAGGQPTATASPLAADPAQPTVTSVPPSAATALPKLDLPEIKPEQFDSIVSQWKADADALERAGGDFDVALSQGHNFGTGRMIPWQKMASSPDSPSSSSLVEDLIARTADVLERNTIKAKAGAAETGVLSDASVNMLVGKIASAWGVDPAAVIGTISEAGKQARTMVSKMEAAFLLGQRVAVDAKALAIRIRAGDLTKWGGDEALAKAELLDTLRVQTSLLDAGISMRAAGGRMVRRNRAEFAPSEEALSKLAGLDTMKLAELVDNAGGDPRVIRKLLQPSMIDRVLDASQWLLVNNLLWGWRTHFVNFSTNTYMTAVRPAERWIGSWATSGEHGPRIRAESARQYYEMGNNLYDAFEAARQTWKSGDSVMAPHTLMEGGSQPMHSAQWAFRPFDSMANVAYNAMVSVGKTIGLPTRALGTVDELIKQVVYRSKIASAAHVRGVEEGLQGKALTDYVRTTVMNGFDDAGHAVDSAALQEARTSAFNQPLLPGTIGKSVQGFMANHKSFRPIVPFIQTPTNVIRYGVKMTPGLNLLQQEYRQMITGAYGVEAQAQAVGQMAMGTLLASTAAFLSHSGAITGAGPSDPKALAQLKATGWQPYSFVVHHDDGTRSYVNYGRFDPVAMPLGVIADLIDIMEVANSSGDQSLLDKAQAGASGLVLGLSRQLQQKTYLKSIGDTIGAIMSPGTDAEKVSRAVNQQLANFVPMSSALRYVNTDPYMRDARDFVDTLKAGTPGLSATLPPKRDAFGDPIRNNKGLWITSMFDVVDREVERMADEQNTALQPPQPVIGKVDLRDITMKNGRNAYDYMQEVAARPSPNMPSLKEAAAKLIKSKAYQAAPDGDANVKGTKMWMLSGVAAKYRHVASEKIKADPNVRAEMMASKKEVFDHYAKQKAQDELKASAAMDRMRAIGESFGVQFPNN